MKKSRFVEAQVMGVLRQVEIGMVLADVSSVHAIRSATFYEYYSKYGGTDASMIANIKVMEDENHRLVQDYVTEWLWTYNNDPPTWDSVGSHLHRN
jgi:putative transposase